MAGRDCRGGPMPTGGQIQVLEVDRLAAITGQLA
jgi:hypothetical protein